MLFPLAQAFTPGLVQWREFLSPIYGAFATSFNQGRGLKAVGQSLLKEACELVVFSSPGVNAWAREKSFAAAV